MLWIYSYFNHLIKNRLLIVRLQFVLFGFMNNLASHLVRISYPGGEMITQRFGFTKNFAKEWNNIVYCRLSKNLCGFKDQVRACPSCEKYGLTRSPLIHSYGYGSAGDRTTCFTSVPLKSKSFMQYPG